MNNAKIPPSDSYDEYHIKELQDINYAAVYLEAVIEDHDPEDIQTNFLKLALSDVAEAIAPEQLATHTEILETILQKQGAEAIYGLADWLKGLGLKLTVTVDKDAEIQDSAPDHSEIEVHEMIPIAA
jgi:DNA-binding phage protein